MALALGTSESLFRTESDLEEWWATLDTNLPPDGWVIGIPLLGSTDYMIYIYIIYINVYIYILYII